jgi:hypothetical protein
MSLFLLWVRTHPKHALVIGLLVIFLFVLGGVYLKGRHDAAAHAAAQRRIDEAAAMAADKRADEKSQQVLAADAAKTAAKKKELEDAVAQVPDSVPDAVAVRSGCVELQQHGISTADLPACKPAGAAAGTRPNP